MKGTTESNIVGSFAKFILVWLMRMKSLRNSIAHIRYEYEHISARCARQTLFKRFTYCL